MNDCRGSCIYTAKTVLTVLLEVPARVHNSTGNTKKEVKHVIGVPFAVFHSTVNYLLAQTSVSEVPAFALSPPL